MAHCLGIPEILRLVCDGVNKKGALSIALTCRAFLEPALDRLWHEMTSLQPLIHCLPDDLLVEDDDDVAVYSLRRTLTSQDLERYLKTYAHRIREFALVPDLKRPSLDLDVLNALQLVTGYRSGALSPRLQYFEWPSPTFDRGYWPAPSIERMSPQLSLFLGSSILRVSIEWHGEDYPLYTGSVMFSTGHFSNVKELTLVSSEDSEMGSGLPASFPWSSSLEVITIGSRLLSHEHLCTLSGLHQLRSMKLLDNESALDDLYYMDEVARAASACRSNPSSFASLRSLSIKTFCLASPNSVLQFFPKENKLERIELMIDTSSPSDNCQEVLKGVYDYCNPLHLQNFQFCDCVASILAEETVYMDDEEEEDVDLWSLCKFTALKDIRIRCGGQIAFYPRELSRLASWPHLRCLDLCSMQYSYGRMPSFDHIHLLEILNYCSGLHYLGLRFDASRLKAEEETSSQSFKLRTLRVGESPIRSPSRVAKFIKLHLPFLKELDATYFTPSSFERPNMLDKRWTEVAKLVL